MDNLNKRVQSIAYSSFFFYLNIYGYKTGHVRQTSLLDKQLMEPNWGDGGGVKKGSGSFAGYEHIV